MILTETDTTSQVLLVRPDSEQRQLLHEDLLTMALDVTPDGRCVLLRRGPRGSRDLLVLCEGALRCVVPAGEGSSERGCLSPDGSTVYARTDAMSELAELVYGERVDGRADGELEDVALSGDGSVAALTWNIGGGVSALTLLDTPTGRRTDIAKLPRQVVHGCELSHDGGTLVLTAQGPSDPKGVWCGPSGSELTPLSSPGRGTLHASRGASVSGIDPQEVVAPLLHRFPSADETEITGWLYRPARAGRLPTIVWLHGGPDAQERPTYNSPYQSLLAQDIAVFAPNVRGSTGFGRSFRTTDDGSGRYGAFEDVAACAAYLVEAGIATPGRLGISGRSYGGYLTLAVLTRYPELFQVGIDVCGMSDLQTWYATTEPWIAAAAVIKYGDPVVTLTSWPTCHRCTQ